VQTTVDRGGPGGNEAWSRGVDTGRAESHCRRVWVNRDWGFGGLRLCVLRRGEGID
jgi:hypothetical protein